MKNIEVIGHRGARGLFPELSLPGFAKAIELGVDGIELDVGITSDLQVVAYHDYALNPDITRTGDGRWIQDKGLKIRDLSLEQLQQYEVGEIRLNSTYAKTFPHQKSLNSCSIPTLEEIVKLVNQQPRCIRYCIELKRTPNFPNATADLEVFADIFSTEIERLNISNQSTILSFDWNLLAQVKLIQPDLKICYLTSELDEFNTVSDNLEGIWTAGLLLSDFNESIPQMVNAVNGSIWGTNFEALSYEKIAEAHQLGIKVNAWTVNETTDFEFLIAAGIDEITTDYPDRLLKFLART